MKRLMALALAGGLAVAAVPANADETVLKARCAQCHERLPDGGLNRISQIRKSPEGWLMSIQRMKLIHGVQFDEDELRSMVKYLSDRQGLAPEEAEPHRYLMERTPNLIEAAPEGDLGVLCARCHSYGRVALQRRDAGEWTKLAHTHLGQWPTAEYQAGARDRNWWTIVSTEVPKILGEKYSFKTQAWSDWQKHKKADLAGTWIVSGQRADGTPFGGTAKVTGDGKDGYTAAYTVTDAAGKAMSWTSKATVYTGYEWRGSATMDGADVREVFAASKDGSSLSGRFFIADADELGGTFSASRDTGKPAIAGLSRAYLKAGETARITIWGSSLSGDVSFGPGITAKVVSRNAHSVVVDAAAGANSTPGVQTVSVGAAEAEGALAVYRNVDLVKVEPEFAIARVGGNGGPIPGVKTQFHAVAYMAGPDGKPETDDDVRIGIMPAKWSLAPFNEFAEQMKDAEFAGEIDGSGLFHPADAGPNPRRPMNLNNVGDLKVNASVGDATGSGHLIVTVQRWNDPPLR